MHERKAVQIADMTMPHWESPLDKAVIGMPNNESYLEHRKQHHGDEPIKMRKEFFCEAQGERYNSKDGKISRCC